MSAKQAVSYLSKDMLLHIDMLEILKQNDTEILQASNRGVLLYNESCGVYMISAQDGQTAEKMLSSVRQPEVIVTHQNFCIDTVQKQFCFRRKTACHQAAYFKRDPLPVPESAAVIRPLDESYLPFLLKHYSLAGIVSVQELLESGSMFGAFLSGALAGFIGTHAEGSMGLLEVLPEYRRQGIAVVLETFLINRFLAEGRVPFAQIIAGNTASLKLQQKLGFTVSEQAICWLE
ncbi:GNAT family N-acetyltransferase [Caproiciproducens sp. CPB-2]|uniref:GNAT family N-acetyltransferase n=1 Tax=Caproiciproducens sp. CPB-2 TaxID=3030017 RepID=UPI0023DC7429|nr:GNAT family N-acetyltransferase [Caproiciproducens sp. CPB-2]MDF1495758.1 GNAT family N-acetyltransferase [Caproiciproducens sp. CPB-2]